MTGQLPFVESPPPSWPAGVLGEPRLATGGARLSLRILQIGAIAVVLVVSGLIVYDLDRFFVPKELVLHATAALAAIFALRAIARGTFTRVDLLLAGYLGLSALSALFATNCWLGFRALAISASGILLFWTARALREAGLARPLLGALAIAVAAAALTALVQTYGLDVHALFADTRVPGGTLGNRNFIAHAAAFGLPLLLLAALAAQHPRMRILGSLGVMLVAATLVLTRSRAAWLAFGAVILVLLVAMIASPPLRRDGTTWRRLFQIVALSALGVAAALFIPNSLRWYSDNPYMQTLKHVTDYQQGSGRGRLVQYRQSMVMALHHPIFGVGPGNWPVVYPAHAAGRHDPSLSDSEGGMTSNPWPSSDWIASISERGLAATILLALAVLGIAMGAVRQLVRARDVGEGLLATALIGAIVGAGVVSLFDAVLLLAAPTLLIWTTLGVLWTPESPRPMRTPILAAAILLSLLGAVHSGMQWAAMDVSTNGDRASLTRAARLDPGNFRVQLRLARIGSRTQRCPHARVAAGLYPHAQTAVAAARGCQ